MKSDFCAEQLLAILASASDNTPIPVCISGQHIFLSFTEHGYTLEEAVRLSLSSPKQEEV